VAGKRTIDPLAPVDHSLIEYDDFAKDFYTEHPSIAALTDQQVPGTPLTLTCDCSPMLCSCRQHSHAAPRDEPSDFCDMQITW